MTDDRRMSGFAGLDLNDLEQQEPAPKRSKREIDATASAPSRETVRVREVRGQMNLSLKLSEIERFERLCKGEDLSKAKMLVRLMDHFETR